MSCDIQLRMIEVGKPRHKDSAKSMSLSSARHESNAEWSRLAKQDTGGMPNDRGWQAKTQEQCRMIEAGKPRHKDSAKSMSLSSARHESNAEWSRLANQDTRGMPNDRGWQTKTQEQCRMIEVGKRKTQEQWRVIEVGKPRHKSNDEWSRLASQDTRAVPSQWACQAQDTKAMPSDRGWQTKTQKQCRVNDYGKRKTQEQCRVIKVDKRTATKAGSTLLWSLALAVNSLVPVEETDRHYWNFARVSWILLPCGLFVKPGQSNWTVPVAWEQSQHWMLLGQMHISIDRRPISPPDSVCYFS